LTDFEFVVLHRTLHDGPSLAHRFCSGDVATLILGFMNDITTELPCGEH
jgi:hypothetical protein